MKLLTMKEQSSGAQWNTSVRTIATFNSGRTFVTAIGTCAVSPFKSFVSRLEIIRLYSRLICAAITHIKAEKTRPPVKVTSAPIPPATRPLNTRTILNLTVVFGFCRVVDSS